MRNRLTLTCRLGKGLIVIGLLYAATAGAGTQYVSDQSSINLRHGPGTKHRTERQLDVGTQLQPLDQPSNGWTHVRSPDGQTGYVLTRFLSDQAPSHDRVADLEQQVSSLRSDNADLKKKLTQALQGSDAAADVKHSLVARNEKLKSQLAHIRETSADAIRIGKENEKYRKQLMSLHTDVDRLKHENKTLRSHRGGMKVGALILLVGILLGLALPALRRRRKRNWDSL